MAKILRVHELAKELGMSNQETLDLCGKLGVGVKTQSSTIIDQQADRVRARAERDGLKRDVQPEEPKPVKKAAKNAAPKATTEEGGDAKPVKKAAKKQLRRRLLRKKQQQKRLKQPKRLLSKLQLLQHQHQLLSHTLHQLHLLDL